MAETGLNQNWNRDYDPLTGKYFESDLIGLDGGINTYNYVYDDPIAFSDPKGLYSYNAPPPQTVPIPPALGAKVSCIEKCSGNPLVITGGREHQKPGGGLYHTPNSLHYSGHAVDFGFNSNPWIADQVTKFLCCAVGCGLAYGGPEQLGSSRAHFHLQDIPGNGYYKPWPTCCSNQ